MGGYVTLEFSNTNSLPAKIYANEGVAQVVFLKPQLTYFEESYKDKGKYQIKKVLQANYSFKYLDFFKMRIPL